MTKPKRILLAGLLVVLLGGFVWLVLRPNEPMYQGKPLSFWLQGYDPVNFRLDHPKAPPPPSQEAADEAVRAIGTNAIPRLLRMLQQPDSQLMLTIRRLRLSHHFDWIPFAPANRESHAFSGLCTLDSRASNAVPQLIEIFKHAASPFLQTAVPVILGNMGPSAAPAIPALLRGTTHTNEVVRNNALFAQGQIHAEPALVVPALIKNLNDTNAQLRAQAAHSLGEFGFVAHSAVPELLELLHAEALVSSSASCSYTSAYVSRLSSGVLLQMWGGQFLVSVIKDALKAIDPAALANAGVQ